MANLLFDFDLSNFGISPTPYQPYIGVGVGYAWNEIRNARFNPGGSGYRIDDTGGAIRLSGDRWLVPSASAGRACR